MESGKKFDKCEYQKINCGKILEKPEINLKTSQYLPIKLWFIWKEQATKLYHSWSFTLVLKIVTWIVIVHVLRYYRVIQKPHSLTAVLQKTWTLTEFARRKKRCHPLLVRLTLVRAQWVRQRESGTACSLARIAAWRSLCLKSKARFSIQCPYWLHLCIF